MLIDKLVTMDVQLTACNDDQYFVFEDVLYQVRLVVGKSLGRGGVRARLYTRKLVGRTNAKW